MTIPRPLTGESNVRWFPVITDRMARPRNNKIPWRLAEIAYTEYARRYGTDQSLERIAERGGFGILEIADYLLAQLKDRNEKLAAMAAALRAAGNRWHRNRVDHCPGYPTHTSNVEDIEDCLHPECVEVVAALSPDAGTGDIVLEGVRRQADWWKSYNEGKGWVSPEVREQVRGALALVKKHQKETPHKPLPHWAAVEVCAALDALKEGK